MHLIDVVSASLSAINRQDMKYLFGGISWHSGGFPGGPSGKESTCQFKRCKRHGFDPWVGKIPWRRKWQPTSVFLPRKSQKSLPEEPGRLQCMGSQSQNAFYTSVPSEVNCSCLVSPKEHIHCFQDKKVISKVGNEFKINQLFFMLFPKICGVQFWILKPSQSQS